jgi:hypothetical protein
MALLPVRIDIFTKLMGDVVERRREFIQDNSPSANVYDPAACFWKKAISCGKKAITRSVKAIAA